jgi:hypothetical protein
MADFNQSPLGQTSIAVPLTGVSPSSSAADPAWQLPTWLIASASEAISLGGGSIALPTTGQIWPVSW